MAISFVGSVAASGANNGGNVTLSLTGLSLQQGDVVVAVAANSHTADFAMATSSSGWTKADELYQNHSSFDTNLAAWYKVMGASPDTSFVATGPGGAANANTATAFAFRGCDAAVLDVTPTKASGTATQRPNPAAITPSTSGAWILVAGAGSAGAGSVYTQASTDLSQTANHFRAINHAETNDCTLGVGIKTDWASGAYDPAAWTSGSTDATGSWASITLALKPQGAITGTLTKTLGGLTRTIAAALRIGGTTTKTLGGLTGSSTGTVQDNTGVTGALTRTLGSLASGASAALRIAGNAAKTLGGMSVSAQGTVGNPPGPPPTIRRGPLSLSLSKKGVRL